MWVEMDDSLANRGRGHSQIISSTLTSKNSVSYKKLRCILDFERSRNKKQNPAKENSLCLTIVRCERGSSLGLFKGPIFMNQPV